MPRADEIHQVSDHVFFWQAYDPAVKSDLSCCAVRAAEGLVFIDPVDLADVEMEGLAEAAPPAAIVLTNGNHARTAAKFRSRFQVPILAHAGALAGLALSVDRELADGDIVAGDLRVIALPGAGPGEIALYSQRGSMHVGDALIHVEPLGFTFLPEKYCLDAKLLRGSAQKLLRHEFDLLTFAHGTPLVPQAHLRLAHLLAS